MRAAEDPFSEIIGTWPPLTYALDAVHRSMGLDDLYPLVLAPRVIDKPAFGHDRVLALACSSPSG